VNETIAFLELKYGNIYGGYPNFYAISEACVLVFELRTNKIFMDSMHVPADVDIVNVYSKTDELGTTVSKVREVMNMRTGRIRPFDETYQASEQDLDEAIYRLRPARNHIRQFFMRNQRKYRYRTLLTFDGRRDIFLCQKAGVRFNMQIIDLQKEIMRETNYLFSLNKLAKIINYRQAEDYLVSNNLRYWLHPVAQQQLHPGNAAHDACRLLMVNNEFQEHHKDFLMKAALQLNKIEMAKKEDFS